MLAMDDARDNQSVHSGVICDESLSVRVRSFAIPQKLLNQIQSVLLSYRNQSIDLQCK